MKKKRSTLAWALALPKSDLLVLKGLVEVVKYACKICFFIDIEEEIQLSEIHPILVLLYYHCVSSHTPMRIHCPFQLFSEIFFLKLPLEVSVSIIFSKGLMQKITLWSCTKVGICSTDIYRWSHGGLECSGHRKPYGNKQFLREEINFFLYTKLNSNINHQELCWPWTHSVFVHSSKVEIRIRFEYPVLSFMAFKHANNPCAECAWFI